MSFNLELFSFIFLSSSDCRSISLYNLCLPSDILAFSSSSLRTLACDRSSFGDGRTISDIISGRSRLGERRSGDVREERIVYRLSRSSGGIEVYGLVGDRNRGDRYPEWLDSIDELRTGFGPVECCDIIDWVRLVFMLTKSCPRAIANDPPHDICFTFLPYKATSGNGLVRGS